jgi:hypothetical protein
MDLGGVNPWLDKITDRQGDNTPSPLEIVKIQSIKHTRLEPKYTSATFFAEYNTRQMSSSLCRVPCTRKYKQSCFNGHRPEESSSPWAWCRQYRWYMNSEMSGNGLAIFHAFVGDEAMTGSMHHAIQWHATGTHAPAAYFVLPCKSLCGYAYI